MSDVTILRETFDPPKNFCLTDYIRESMPAPVLQAQVMFDAIAADRAKREWWQGIIDEQHTSDGIFPCLSSRFFDSWERVCHRCRNHPDDLDSVIAVSLFTKAKTRPARRYHEDLGITLQEVRLREGQIIPV